MANGGPILCSSEMKTEKAAKKSHLRSELVEEEEVEVEVEEVEERKEVGVGEVLANLQTC